MPASSSHRRYVTGAQGLLIGDLVICLLALGLIVGTDIRTVLITGPLLLGAGLITTVVACKARYRAALFIGMAHCAVCVLMVTLVNILEWSPDRARHPFEVMGSGFTIAIALATWFAFRNAPPWSEPWTCSACGYLLYGLTEPRCPECGRLFDPAEFAGLPPPATAAGVEPSRYRG